jgi:hypothetical protein
MQLLTPQLRSILPPLGSQRGQADPIIYARFWIPDVNWVWYVTEGQGDQSAFQFYGYVVGLDEEWEHFSLRDLEAVHSPGGAYVERDVNFSPTRWSEIESLRKTQTT